MQSFMEPLLSKGEPPPVFDIRGNGQRPVLLACEHAGNRVPEKLDGLGLSPADLERHIAFDPGAGSLTLRVAEELGADAVLARYSRLAVECNRAPDDPHLLREQSDGTVIPGNRDLALPARRQRERELFWPFHVTVARKLMELDARFGVPTLFVCLHSFSPRLEGGDTRRPWQMGVCWKNDEKNARKLIEFLQRKKPDWTIGDNAPYSLKEVQAFTLNLHADAGRPHLVVEIRNDMLADEKNVQEIAGLLAEFIKENFPAPAPGAVPQRPEYRLGEISRSLPRWWL